MKKLMILIIFFTITVFTSNCTKNFDEINTNPKAFTIDKLDNATYGYIVRRAFYYPVYFRQEGTMQLMHSVFCDTYANYFATTAPSFLSDRYVLVGSWINIFFNAFYNVSCPPIKYAEDYAREQGFAVEEAMMKIWKVYAYHRFTDLFGPIPYSEFGNMKKSVPYDSQEAIYTSFFSELDKAVTVLKANSGKTSLLATYDAIYAGNVDKWAKFGSSLRLRLALRVKYVNPTLAKAQAEKAVADGVISANADNGWMTTSSDWYNSYTRITQWGEFRMSADMESILKGYLDPRVSSYYAMAATPDPTDDAVEFAFNYEGLRNGMTTSARQAPNINQIASNMAAPYTKVGDKGPNWPIMRAAESYFLKAEGALEGWAMGGTASAFYATGIQTSLAENGYSSYKNLVNEDYVTSSRIPASPASGLAPVSTIPIAFLSGGSKEKQLEQIITQKWIGLFPDSPEAFAERRRTKYPVLFPRLASDNLDVAATSVPSRLTYTTNEYTNNNAAVQEAISKLGGPDNGATKLWWDKK